jgi:uracil-DNA glycosylase
MPDRSHHPGHVDEAYALLADYEGPDAAAAAAEIGRMARVRAATPTLPADWVEHLAAEFDEPYWADLMSYLVDQRDEHGADAIYPAPDRIFAAFDLTRYADVRVVIIGQDPYPQPGNATGLAFAVAEGVRPPRSLAAIYRELASDLHIDIPATTTLEGWARQGVLLLNTTLTVRSGSAGSHRRRGWERFTDQVVRAVNDNPQRVVFLLWGKDAQKKRRLITRPQHRVIATAHPTPRPNAHPPLLAGSHCFSEVDALLIDAHRKKIDWARTG